MGTDSTFLGTEKIGKLLFRLSIPAITAHVETVVLMSKVEK